MEERFLTELNASIPNSFHLKRADLSNQNKFFKNLQKGKKWKQKIWSEFYEVFGDKQKDKIAFGVA